MNEWRSFWRLLEGSTVSFWPLTLLFAEALSFLAIHSDVSVRNSQTRGRQRVGMVLYYVTHIETYAKERQNRRDLS